MKNASSVSRRSFLYGSSSVAASVFLLNATSSATSLKTLTVRKRKSITALNQDEVNAWRAGVRVMKQRSVADPNNPRGWVFQANMHGSASSNPMFNLCQHGHWWFLAWHRMYIFYFEQILLQAIVESGVPVSQEFGLPYWDYTAPSTGGSSSPPAISKRTIPQVFRDRTYIPTTGMSAVANPLFHANRISSRNRELNPNPLDASAVSVSTAFGYSNFINTTTSVVSGFGGRNRSTPTYFDPNRSGAFEGTPHGTVHNGVGGDMSNFETAARDPIFWTHHCNLDRLWNVWLKRPNTENPSPTSAWATQEFKFIDGAGNQVQHPVAKFLDNVEGNLIDYEYDDGGTPFSAPMIAFTPAASNEQVHNVDAHNKENHMTDAREVAVFPPRLKLDANAKTIKIQLEEGSQRDVAAVINTEIAKQNSLLLELSGVHIDAPIDGHYEIYINLPDGMEPDFESAHFVGNLIPFSLRAHSHAEADTVFHEHNDGPHKDATEPREVTVRWDISKQARLLHTMGLWHSNGPKITFIPRGVEDVGEKSKARLTFRGFRLLESASE